MATQQGSFDQQVIVVTGGSSGIGFATAQAFLVQGAKRVYITARQADKLAQAVAQLGDSATGIVADVSRAADLAHLSAQIAGDGHQLDVIFANAGIAESNTLGTTVEDDFDRTFDINVKGVFFTVQTLLPLLKNEGSVVLNASVAANKGMADLSVYSASKAAVRSFARTWAQDLRERKIRVNAISPGVTRTPIMENGLKMDEAQITQFAAFLSQAAPAGRMAVPAEIAEAVLFLASKAASYVNGIELSVDGGFTHVNKNKVGR